MNQKDDGKERKMFCKQGYVHVLKVKQASGKFPIVIVTIIIIMCTEMS
jgi:hypothetical protein